MKLTLGFSPCPNDTFIFDALVNHKIDTEGIDFEYLMSDVEDLNKLAFQQRLDITKVSFHAYLYLHEHYVLLDSGSALGFGTGPLLIAKKFIPIDELNGKKVAIPGRYTTANLLFSLAAPKDAEKVEMVFSSIESAILEGTVEAGVIIHENRFTYQDKGLVKISDLGEFWEQLTSCPIPLGGIIARRDLPGDVILKVNRLIRKSLEYAFEKNMLTDFIRCNAQEMSEDVMRRHINLYVNDFSLNLGKQGKDAVLALFTKAQETGLIAGHSGRLFLE